MNDRDLRFVAHIDILGMSAIVEKDADEAWGMLSDLVAVRDQVGRYEILHKAMCRCVPVRVGSSFGRFFFNIEKSMYAGPALIEAYRVGEAAQWLGIALAESVQEKASSLGMMSGKSKIVVRWALPLKGGTEPCFVVNWPAVVAHDLTVKPPVSVPRFYQGSATAKAR